MQYQVQLDPNKLVSYGVSVSQIVDQLAANNANAGGGFYSQGGQFFYVRGLGQVRNLDDIGNIVVATHNGIPVYVKDVATVAIDHAPRLGQFGYMRQDDAVEGVILMRVGEQAQVVLKKVEALTETLNKTVLPPDVKIVPYYDRTDLIAETTKTVEANLVRGMLIVLVILVLFLFSVRTALIVAVTIPFALLFAFICLDWAHIPANLLSIGAIDFGMIVDGACRHGGEHLPRAGGTARRDIRRDRRHSRRGARRRAAHLLRKRRHHRGLPADLRLDRAVRTPVPADGGHDVVRAARVAAVLADAAARALRVFPPQTSQGADRVAVRARARCVRAAA